MIELDNVSFAYRTGEADAVPALRDLNLKIERRQLVAIIGHNGSGKSTLIKLLAAVLYPTEGEIRIDGVPVDREHQWEVRRRVSVVFQDPKCPLFCLGCQIKKLQLCMRIQGLRLC